jgi:hypothetical protein
MFRRYAVGIRLGFAAGVVENCLSIIGPTSVSIMLPLTGSSWLADAFGNANLSGRFLASKSING